jgi:Domain of unknown function (DUF4105)
MNKIYRTLSCSLITALLLLSRNALADYSYHEIKMLSVQQGIYNNQEWKNLLHYHGKKSVINPESPFFLSKNGYKNPQQEYELTLKGFLKKNSNNNHIICRYPARFNFLIRNLKLHKKQFPQPNCKKYKEYLKRVPIDKVSVIFAAENTTSPSSMMGHTFIKISGTDINNNLKQHVFSYFARVENTNTSSFYFQVMTSGTHGVYALLPYQKKAQEYLYQEERSLWEFDLKLNSQQIKNLRDHLWELKEKDIQYSFIDHNCNTALIQILKIADNNLDSHIKKPFITPVEYIQELNKREAITRVSIIPNTYTSKKILQNKLGNILNAPKPFRASLFYDHYINNNLGIELSPVYQDIRDISNAYSDELESKMLSLDLGFNPENSRIFVKNIDLLKMKSIPDYSLNHDLVKYFKFSFETDLGKETSDLKPTIEFGLGYGYSHSNLTAYFLPKVGYRQNKYANLYISPEFGLIFKPLDKFKFITSYNPYYNSNDNNRGYNSEYQFYSGYSLGKEKEVYFKYNYYTATQELNRVVIGITTHF